MKTWAEGFTPEALQQRLWADRGAFYLLDVDEVLEMLLHTHQLAVVNRVGCVYQPDLFLIHFANVKILEKSETSLLKAFLWLLQHR